MEFDSSCCFLLLLEFDSSPFRVDPEGEAQQAQKARPRSSARCWSQRRSPASPLIAKWGIQEVLAFTIAEKSSEMERSGFGTISFLCKYPSRGSRLHCATEYDSCFQKFDFLRFGHPMCTVGCVWAPVWICLLVRWLHNRHNRQGKSHRVEMARG